MKNSTRKHQWTSNGHPMDIQWIRNRKGSILIWTLLLGFVLTSVFFFFAMRQRAAIAIQRDTAAILNARTFVESYADYLEKNPKELNTLFEGIHTSLTQNVDKIESFMDYGNMETYNFSGDIFVEWNKCPKPGEPNPQKGDLKLNDALYEKKGEGCTAKKEYDDIIGPVSVTDPFTLETANAPFLYRITAKDNSTALKDSKWHMDLKLELDYGRAEEVKRTF